MAGSRQALTLRFAQFRRLTLLRPLLPLPIDPDRTTPLLPMQGLAICRLSFRDGPTVRLPSVGHVELDIGVFTFRPTDAAGTVERSFFPRARLARAVLGERRTDRDGPDPLDEPPPQHRDDLADHTGPADHADTVPLALLDPATAPATPAAPATPTTPTPSTAPTATRLPPGELLASQVLSTADALLQALEQQARMPMVRIGEALLALGYISEAKLGDALQAQSHDRSLPLGELLVQRGDVSRADLQTALARKMGYPIIDAASFPTELEAAQRLPVSLARRLTALPLLYRDGRLVVALEDPSARHAIDEIEFISQCKVVTVLARAGTLAGALERSYLRLGQENIEPSADLLGGGVAFGDDGDNSANKLLANLELQQSHDARTEEPQIEQSDNSLVRLINQMILEARQQGVSDIHIECQPGKEKVRVRFRRDGVLRPYIELPHTYRQALVARLKIMCDLDISERRKPQDGKINFGRWVQGQKLELRVATIPTANGLEDVVMRLLASA
ncbi:MAG: pilus assembly protein PilB, partial [Burkholderiales bacterium PBB5]